MVLFCTGSCCTFVQRLNLHYNLTLYTAIDEGIEKIRFSEKMAGVALVAGLQGDPPPVPGQDFLLLPDPDGGVLNHGGVQNMMEEIRPENQEEKKKLVLKVKK